MACSHRVEVDADVIAPCCLGDLDAEGSPGWDWTSPAKDGEDAGVACRTGQRGGQHNAGKWNRVANKKLVELSRRIGECLTGSRANFHNRC